MLEMIKMEAERKGYLVEIKNDYEAFINTEELQFVIDLLDNFVKISNQSIQVIVWFEKNIPSGVNWFMVDWHRLLQNIVPLNKIEQTKMLMNTLNSLGLSSEDILLLVSKIKY